MSLLSLIGLIAACGAMGGVANCAIAGEFVLPRIDKSAKTWRPGWIGNVLVGSIAAVVIAGMYGPLSQVVLNATTPPTLPPVTMANLLGAVVVGLGGGNILTQLAQRQADQLARENLTATLAQLTASRAPPPKKAKAKGQA